MERKADLSGRVMGIGKAIYGNMGVSKYGSKTTLSGCVLNVWDCRCVFESIY